MTEKPSIKPPRTSLDKNTILIGQKPVMRYVNAIVMRLGEGSEVIIRARGRAIPTAVDAAQVSCRRFFGGKLAVSNVSIGTETLDSENGQKHNVSTIEIKLFKKE